VPEKPGADPAGTLWLTDTVDLLEALDDVQLFGMSGALSANVRSFRPIVSTTNSSPP
jgi:hypothetical protein